MPSRILLLRLPVILYILLCLGFSSLAARNFQARLAHLSSTSEFVSLLAVYLIVLGALAFVLAVVFAMLTAGRIFAVVGYVVTELFVVLPLAMVIFLLVVRTAKSDQLSPLAVSSVSLALLIGAVLLVGIYLYARFVEPYRLQTVFYQVRSAKLAGLDQTLRIVVLADIQTDWVAHYEQKVFRRTLELKPDLILLAGDYLQCPDRESYRLQAQRLGKMLNDLRFTAPLGLFAVPGNSESYNGTDCFDNTDVQWLLDQTVRLKQGKATICLTGLSVKTGALSTVAPSDLLSGLDSSLFNIVLSHFPDFVLGLPAEHSVDLSLAGHTHGGQICLPFIGALTTACRIPRAQASGSHNINGTRLCISPGIGVERGWAPRLRFFCPPQIMVIDLRTD